MLLEEKLSRSRIKKFFEFRFPHQPGPPLKNIRFACAPCLVILYMGADAVIAPDLDFGNKGQMLFVVASGTAIKLREK